MKQYNNQDVRNLKGLPYGVLQSKFGEIDNALAQSYLDKLIVRTKVREFKEKKIYPVIQELQFIQVQMDEMELQLRKFIQENKRLEQEIKYLKA
jgi:hypothetical protein